MFMDITSTIKYIGVKDNDIDLFEGQYRVPKGVLYNSYVIFDEKIAIMDTADARKGAEWWNNLTSTLDGRTPDYLVVQHMEPDHSSLIAEVMERFPSLKVVASAIAIKMMPQFFSEPDFQSRTITVKEGDTLCLGSRELTFVAAPMVHWPEVILSYDNKEKVLFSADAFGTFGETIEEGWNDEARRYYLNIVGKYGTQVQTLLKKAATLDIATICPLHGPVLKENLGRYIALYDTWSSYRPETEGVFVAYASIYGGTAEVALKIADTLRSLGVEVITADLARCDASQALADAFRMSRMVLCASSYDAGVFPPMHHFLHHLKMKNFQNRRVALVENGSWAPTAGRVMRSMLEEMKNIEVVEPVVTIKSRMKAEDAEAIEALVKSIQ
ncbi:MAG: FprA family A-type flavoprotein [Bacteroidaceae bacterium]|nr:FprA family A-type flavoprotein [Bacteroidaceae bacterium]